MSRSSLLAPRSPRSALTLIELLVVIIILTTIVAAAIPLMAPADENRRLREASRGLQAFISAAQARAIALNRPVGIALKRLGLDTGRADDNGVCLEVFYVEQAPPYSGFDANSRACVGLHPTKIGLALVRFMTRGTPTGPRMPPGWTTEPFPSHMIRPGDVIEINGTRFELISPTTDQWATLFAPPDNNKDDDQSSGYYIPPRPSTASIVLVRPLNDSGQQINPRYDHLGREISGGTGDPEAPYWTSPAPYKIFRQATPTSDEPYQLPEGTAIDLRASGVGSDDYFYVPGMNDNAENVLIMFAPEGRVARVSFSQLPLEPRSGNQPAESPTFDKPVAENVYLLIGQRAKIPAPAAGADPTLNNSKVGAARTDEQRLELKKPINWLSGDSRWIVIGSQSGRIATIRNGFVDLAEVAVLTSDPEVKRTDQILAAREYTREMAQLEGR